MVKLTSSPIRSQGGEMLKTAFKFVMLETQNRGAIFEWHAAIFLAEWMVFAEGKSWRDCVQHDAISG